MSTAPPNFEKQLKSYLEKINSANSEATKAYHFLNFTRDIFKAIAADYLETSFPELEKTLASKSKTLVFKGRIDAYLGNLIIEFKKELDKKSLEEAESELRRYISILWTQQGEHRVSYITIATDGKKCVSYRPRSIVEKGDLAPDDVFIDQIDQIDLSTTEPGLAFVWLDRYMLTESLRPATAETFSSEFGYGKPAFNDAVAYLTQAWKNHRESVLYDQWASFLRIVYGSDVKSEDLFLRHTYLAMLAKLLAYSSFSGGALPVSSEQISEILEGKVFEKWNVHNFIEEDFFSWVARSEDGIKAASALLESLASYDLTTINEDILKSLYQDLVDPQSRHDLGEYYTPDWLAELMVEKSTEKDPSKTILDPSCGSGTFLAASIRWKKQLLRKKKAYERLESILNSVKGVDVHPLAVILSRANFLTSLGTELLSARRGPISIPVYMADSIRLPDSDITLQAGVKSFKIEAAGKILRLPLDIASDPILADRVVEAVRDYSKEIAEGVKPKLEDFENFLSEKVSYSSKEKLDANTAKVLLETSETMAELIKAKKDTIWAFILKNIYKPLFLRDEKFDVVIGNPPWLSYRYVESTNYQNFLKGLILKDYKLLGSERAELITQMELATLFFARTSDLYLSDHGIISFVMPRSLFVSDQHHNFRKGLFVPKMKILELMDLEDVEPLFHVPSCVVTARKGTNDYPVDGIVFEGLLSQRNSKLNEAVKSLTQTNDKFKCFEIGQRSFLESIKFEKVMKSIERGTRSYYYARFINGATAYPRQFWFVEPVVHPRLRIDPSKPSLRTSARATSRAKKEDETDADIKIEGEVEAKFLYKVITGSELVPFGTTSLPIAVLPIEPNGTKYHLISSDEARQRGYTGLRDWLKQVEEAWKIKRGEKKEIDASSWLNYQNKLTSQNPKAKFKILYNASGKYLVSAVVRNKPSRITADSSRLEINGPIADHKTYWIDTNDLNEAMFVSALLNAPIVDALIKPMQSRGQWGERDIHKKVLELPLPKLNLENKKHIGLISLAKKAETKVEKLLPSMENKYSGIAKIRQLVKIEIAEEVLMIDKIVRDLISEVGSRPNGLEDYLSA